MLDTAMSEPEAETGSCREQKKFFLASLLIYAACFGGVVAFVPEDSTIEDALSYVSAFVSVFLALGWCHYDAIERHCFLSRSMRICLVVCFGLAFPIYLFKSRGLGGFKALAFSGLFLGGMVLAACLAALTCYGAAYLLGIVE